MIKSNPFIKIPKWLPKAILAYFLIYGVFINFFHFFREEEQSLLILGVVILKISILFLKILPLLMPFKNIGLIHPLILPFLLGLARQIFQDPLSLIGVFFAQEVQMIDSFLFNFTSYQVVGLNIQSGIFELSWLLAFYLGYFIFKGKAIHFKARTKFVSQSYYQFAALVGIFIFLAFLQSQGGITAWISQWGAGSSRREAFDDIGPIVRLINTLYFIPLTWFMIKGKAVIRNPVFIASFLLFLAAGFISSGSRSAVLDIIVAFLLVVLIRGGKLPYKTMFLTGAGFYLLFGLLGMIRSASTFNQGNFSWDEIDYTTSTILEQSSTEIEKRSSLGTEIAIYHRVPDQVNYLYGNTYIGAIFFFVPRFLWNDKPHGVGYYAGRDIFNKNAGTPAPAHAEAYWNFGFLGILFLGFLNGWLVRFVAKMYLRYHRTNPGWIIVHIIIITSTVSLSSLGLTELFQRLIFVIPTLKIFKLL